MEQNQRDEQWRARSRAAAKMSLTTYGATPPHLTSHFIARVQMSLYRSSIKSCHPCDIADSVVAPKHTLCMYVTQNKIAARVTAAATLAPPVAKIEHAEQP